MATHALQNLVTFKSSAFETIEERPAIDGIRMLGKDLATWLIGELKFRDFRTDEHPTHRDYGWYFLFSPGASVHRLALSFNPIDSIGEGEWLGCIERMSLVRLLGRRTRNPDKSAIDVIHRILSASSLIQQVHWYSEEELQTKYSSIQHFIS